MKNLKKKDYINIGILIAIFIGIVLLLTRFNFIYGSLKDWSSQHIVIPEYFRLLFYKTKNLFPNFAFNVGAGQNIFNLSYYGLFSPFILLSYFFPFVKMSYFIMGFSILIIISSIMLMYLWLKNNKFDSDVCFLSTFIFMLAGPLIFHSHRHIMFISYMPFLLMGFMAVDSYFKEGRRSLLIFSMFLVIMTSYFYSVGSLLVLLLYGVYKYLNELKKKEKFNLSKFTKWCGNYLLNFIIAVAMGSILLLPTFYSLLNGRGLNNGNINIWLLLLPRIQTNFLLYGTYSLGLSSIFIVSLIDNFLSKKRGNRLFVYVMASIMIFPFIVYILNGTLYIDSKVLIPFLPMCVLMISNSLKNIFKKTYKLSLLLSSSVVVGLVILIFSKLSFGVKFCIDLALLLLFMYEYGIKREKDLIFIPIIIVSLVNCIFVNMGDQLVSFKYIKKINSNRETRLLKKVLANEEKVYRVSDNYLGAESINKVYLLDEYKDSIYSSISNNNFKDFYYNQSGNEVIFRSYGIMGSVNNVLYNMYMANKYIVTDNNPPIGYKEVATDKNIKIYKNDKVLPIGYASLNLMSKKDYNKLEFPYNSEAILKNIIVDKDVPNNFKSNIVKKDIDYVIRKSENLNIFKNSKEIQIRANKKAKLVLELKEELKDKIVFVKFNVVKFNKCNMGDEVISINRISNKLTCGNWKYNNMNYEFNYVISSNDPINSVEIKFSEGLHKISNIETYVMDYNSISEVHNNIDEFVINKKKTIGDYIVGNINVSQDKYFMMSIPYDKGFKIYVDDKKVKYFKADVDFIGFNIKKGRHKIKIRYSSPLLKEGIFISIFGIACFGNILFFENIRNKNKKTKKRSRKRKKKQIEKEKGKENSKKIKQKKIDKNE